MRTSEKVFFPQLMDIMFHLLVLFWRRISFKQIPNYFYCVLCPNSKHMLYVVNFLVVFIQLRFVYIRHCDLCVWWVLIHNESEIFHRWVLTTRGAQWQYNEPHFDFDSCNFRVSKINYGPFVIGFLQFSDLEHNSTLLTTKSSIHFRQKKNLFLFCR